jgi:hypothetical protein
MTLPFAVITLSELEIFEDGSITEVSIETLAFTGKGERIAPEVQSRGFRSRVLSPNSGAVHVPSDPAG